MLRRILFVSLSVGLWGGCNFQQNSNLSRNPFAKRAAIFVMTGGNGSCRTVDDDRSYSVYGRIETAKFFEMMSNFRAKHPDVPTEYVVSCYPLFDHKIVFSGSRHPGKTYGGNLNEFANYLGLYAKLHRKHDYFVMGYSYGGWLAMKTATLLLKFEGAKKIDRLPFLATIDPISQVNCQLTYPLECDRAPSDISPANKKFLSENTSWWTNFYQRETFYLHSGPVQQARENLYIKKSHKAVSYDKAVWDRILSAVITHYDLNKKSEQG